MVLNDIHIDIMDYIIPATCTDTEFRAMWAEFEWENKVCVCVCWNFVTIEERVVAWVNFFWVTCHVSTQVKMI